MNPVGIGPISDVKQLGRRLFCAFYDLCLDEAIARGYKNWSCIVCDSFSPSERSCEAWAEDAEACLDLVRAVFSPVPAAGNGTDPDAGRGIEQGIEQGEAARSGKGIRARMIKECGVIVRILGSESRISLKEIAARSGLHMQSVRRWLNSFSRDHDLRVERGVVIIERGNK